MKNSHLLWSVHTKAQPALGRNEWLHHRSLCLIGRGRRLECDSLGRIYFISSLGKFLRRLSCFRRDH